MTALKRNLTTAVLTAACMLSTPALAVGLDPTEPKPVNLVEDIGASERVEAAALLRVLSQEAASAACHLAHDINPAESRTLMQEAKGKFTLLLDALQHGNPALNIIGAEHRKKTIQIIEGLRAQWAPMLDAEKRLLEDPYDAEALKRIKADNEAILATASLLTSEIAGEYSNPAELLQVDVMLVDFSGRQAMLTQKMAKIACEIWAGNRSDDRVDLLTELMGRYELTLNALRDGMPAAGIKAAPTDEIREKLVKATEAWTIIKDELNFVLANEEVPQKMRETLYHDLNVAMYDMEKLEHMYVIYSKHDYTGEAVVPEGTLLD